MVNRSRARELATTSPDPVAWFETLYSEAADGRAEVPWADLVPNPHLVDWLDDADVSPGRALDVGCGYGDNAAALARRGYEVTAFDVSDSAVSEARQRFSDLPIEFATVDLLSPPAAWRRSFDLVVEVYTLQVLPPEPRAVALAALAGLVAPGGSILVIARGRDKEDAPGEMPWPLMRDELDRLGEHGLENESFEEFLDDETPSVRRFRSVWRRPA